MNVDMTVDQKRQLAGWLMREKDYLLSIRALARTILLPSVTGSEEMISSDLEMVNRMRYALRPEGSPDFQEEDMQTVVEVADRNRFQDKEAFWNEIKSLFKQAIL